MKKLVISTCLIWFVLILLSFLWNANTINENQKNHSLEAARGFLKQIILTRLWNSMHGGVYTPVTENNKPNKYLISENREIISQEGKVYTKINPAYMTRQISEIAEKRDGFKFHITSLHPIRPQNRADKRETKILTSFNTGEKEYFEYLDQKNRQKGFFYMAPLLAETSCLKCHGYQGYKNGDVIGGISIVTPHVSKINFTPLIIAHMILAISGFTAFIFFGYKLHAAYQSIKNKAIIDSLTQIPNRRYFSEKITSELKRAQREKYPISLIMADIDDFKSYNDNYGHLLGDKCLKLVAGSIQKQLKRPGDFCARYGGEEFIILLPATDIEGAKYIAREILVDVEKLEIEHVKSINGYIGLSMGISIADPDKSFSHEELILQADKAMYQAKTKGKNKVIVYED